MRWWLVVARWIWGIKEADINACDLVIPQAYGFNTDKTLTDAAKKILVKAAAIGNRFKAPVAFSGAKIFWKGSKEYEEALRTDYLRKVGYGGDIVLGVSGHANSVTEAEDVRATVGEMADKKIVVICDWCNARSSRMIWKNVFPKSEIFMHTVVGVWDKNNGIKLARSDFRWFVTALLRHAALLILGVERIKKIQHPVQFK